LSREKSIDADDDVVRARRAVPLRHEKIKALSSAEQNSARRADQV